MFQIATGILIFHGNLKYLCAKDKSFSDNFSRLLVNSYCCPKRLTADMIDISFTCRHRVSNGVHAMFLGFSGTASCCLRIFQSDLHVFTLCVFKFLDP